MKEEQEKKQNQIIEGANPKINEKSEKIFKEKISVADEPAFMRLYKKRYQEMQKNLLKTKKLNKENEQNNKKSKENEQKIKKIKKTKKSTKEENKEYIDELYKKALEKKERIEQLKNKIEFNEKIQMNVTKIESSSNKFFLRKFMKDYKEETSRYMEELGRNTNRVNLVELSEILFRLGFIATDSESLNSNKNSEKKENDEVQEGKLQLIEKKLIAQVYENLKDKEDLVNIDHLFIFLLAVVNLYDFYLYSSYKLTEETNNNNNNGETEKKDKEQLKQEIYAKIAKDLETKNVIQRKFGGFDENENFVLTFENAKQINKDFSFLYINFMITSDIKQRAKKPNSSLLNPTDFPFKPTVLEESKKMFEDYRRKIFINVK